MVDKTKRDKIIWTLDSPATPEFIDGYVSDIKRQDNDEFTNAAREAASAYCKRNAKAIMELTIDGKDNYKIGDIADSALAFVDGFDAGARFALKKVEEFPNPLFKS